MKITLVLLSSIVVLIALILIIGWALPVHHVASRQQRLKASSDDVWKVLSDYQGAVTWRSDLKSIEQVESSPGVFVWREVSRGGDTITYATQEAPSERRLIRRIVDKNLPFGGSWTFEVIDDGAETTITITENGEVYSPLFRFMSRFVFGHHGTIDRYMADLRKHVEG